MRSRFPLRGCLAAALTSLLLLTGSAFAAEVAGTVLTLKGDCFVEADGKRTALAVGAEVHIGETLDVPDGAKLKLHMNDGSVVSAGSGTRMAITSATAEGPGGHRDVSVSLTQGLLRAVVAPATQPSRFEVDTANGVAAVRSTDWFVEAGPRTTRVGVLQGKVSLTSRATDKAVDIPARWGAKLETGMDPVQPRLWQQSEFDDVIARTAL